MSELLAFWSAHRDETLALVRQHLFLVIASTAVAVAAGVPAGILAARHPRLGRPLIFAANVAQTVPSLALFGFLLPLPFVGGIGARTALVALTLYALLPIVRTTVAGMRGIDRAIVEASEAMGMTSAQRLWLVELPLALPSIVAGVRVAAVIGVGTATIAAAIGAGGLGEYIFRGLSMVDTTTILAGAVPAAGLALVADGALAWLEHALGRPRPRLVPMLALGVVLPAALALAWPAAHRTGALVVGSKNFTEQVVLGELLAQALEAEGVSVTRRLNLGGTFICDRAVRAGDIDLYVEYTGTAVSAIFHEPVPPDPAEALRVARERYASGGLTVGPPLGFNNTFAILVRGQDARALELQSIDDLSRVAGRWRPGFGYEFLQREDGYAGLVKAYGLPFAHPPVSMDLSLIYKALADGRVDVIAGDATSALIDVLDLAVLEDTRRYFPPYDAIPIVRTPVLLERPEVRRVLDRLAGRISAADMRALNRAVDVERQSPADAAWRFLGSPGGARPSPQN